MFEQIKGNVIYDLGKTVLASAIISWGGQRLLAYTLDKASGVFLILIGLYLFASTFIGKIRKPSKPFLNIDSIRESAVLGFMILEAKDLKRELEDIQDFFENVGETLKQPCDTNAVPNEIKEHRHKKLLTFQSRYRTYLETVRKLAPNLKTELLRAGFPPSNSATCRVLARMIEDHQTDLSSYIKSLEKHEANN
jgi:hypothetical protein